MLNFLCISDDQTAYVKTDSGQVFGIVNAFLVIDENGLIYNNKSVLDIFDEFTDIYQDYEKEANVISFTENNGESYELYIYVDRVELTDNTKITI